MRDEIRAILAAIAYAMEEGELDAGGAASALRLLLEVMPRELADR